MNCRLSLALVFALAPAAVAQSYNITDLGSISPAAVNMWGQVAGNLNNHAVIWTSNGVRDLGVLPGGTFSEADAINDLGVVAGTGDGPGTLYEGSNTYNCTNLVQPFVWSTLKGFTTPSSFQSAWPEAIPSELACLQATFSTGINLFGQVIATNQDFATYIDPYLWNPSSGMSTLPMDYYQETANAINDFGVVVGQAGSEDGWVYSDALIFKNNAPSLLPVPSTLDACSGADSINDLGEIAGWAQASDSTIQLRDCPPTGSVPIHAMLWQSSTAAPADLGTLPGDQYSMAVKVNALGVVVGMSGDGVAVQDLYPFLQVVGRPFIWDPVRGMRDLNDMISGSSGWTLQSVSDINAVGQMVGTGIFQGDVHGFLLTPSLF